MGYFLAFRHLRQPALYLSLDGLANRSVVASAQGDNRYARTVKKGLKPGGGGYVSCQKYEKGRAKYLDMQSSSTTVGNRPKTLFFLQPR